MSGTSLKMLSLSAFFDISKDGFLLILFSSSILTQQFAPPILKIIII